MSNITAVGLISYKRPFGNSGRDLDLSKEIENTVRTFSYRWIPEDSFDLQQAVADIGPVDILYVYAGGLHCRRGRRQPVTAWDIWASHPHVVLHVCRCASKAFRKILQDTAKTGTQVHFDVVSCGGIDEAFSVRDTFLAGGAPHSVTFTIGDDSVAALELATDRLHHDYSSSR